MKEFIINAIAKIIVEPVNRGLDDDYRISYFEDGRYIMSEYGNKDYIMEEYGVIF